MVDVVDAATRSRIMSAIRGKDTGIELQIRKGLFALGRRYRLHGRALPGRPDLVFSRWSAVLFVHGCFWHGHDCPLFRLPATRTEFWREKIASTQARDARNVALLRTAGWRVGTVWECALRGRSSPQIASVIGKLDLWLTGSRPHIEVRL